MSSFRVDMQATKAHHARRTGCTCSYCRNFRKAYRQRPPLAAALLNTLGFDLDGDIEITDFSWNEARTLRVCEVVFPVKGRLEGDNIEYAFDDGTVVTLYQPDSPELIYNNTDMQPPCFFAVLDMKAPWVLDETPD